MSCIFIISTARNPFYSVITYKCSDAQIRHALFYTKHLPVVFLPLVDLLPKIAPEVRSLPLPNHARTTIFFVEIGPFISVARPIKRGQMTNYNH